MARFKLSGALNVPMMLLIPQYSEAYGVQQKSYPAIENGILIYGTFRTFGGTETTENGVFVIEDTATVETWFRPDISANCRIALPQDGSVYEIISTPENIQMQNQYLRFKVQRVKGGA